MANRSVHADFLESFSDEEEDIVGEPPTSNSPQPQEVNHDGTLSKWTNYLHGWQNRYFTLRDGTLSYYKSEFDTGYGSRGSVSVAKANIEIHEFDVCRFDVHVSDCIYYLRANSADEKQKWVDALEASKHTESGYGSETQLGKAVSHLSLVSQTSLHSTSSYQTTAGLREKLMEMETFRDILCRQIDTMQTYFDSCVEKDDQNQSNMRLDLDDDDDDLDFDLSGTTPTPGNVFKGSTAINGPAINSPANQHPPSHGIDFRGEAITFKATTQGVIQVLSHCIDLMVKREDQWKKKLEKEQDKYKKLAEKMKDVEDESCKRSQMMRGPDFMEGPHSMLNEEEFFDAVETALDEESDNDNEELSIEMENIPQPKPTSEIMTAPKHRFTKLVEEKLKENLSLIRERIDQENSEWYMVYEDEENLQVYRKDFEIDGTVCDPLRATYLIEGVSGREVTHYFFDKDVRLEWEVSVEKVKVIEKLAEGTIVQHQYHKRIWPSSQRDTVMISHVRQLSKDEEGERLEKEVGNAWAVTNFSIEHPDGVDSRCVRATANIIMLCQTVTTGEVKKKKYTRENIGCQLTYMAQVNPGGWAPPSVVRQVSKREYPKFLRKFSAFVQGVTKDKALSL